MKPIKKVNIEGFRGILAPLPLDFMRGNRPASMALFGTNGTGKSSITDAWEWLHSGKIEHLRREGARENSFPNVHAEPGHSFIEVEFSDKSLGTVRLEFDHDRVTMPTASGELDKFRELVPHPCHIRYGDLTRFVYLTKSERFDALAQLMGVQPQVELQKGLRRVERRLEEELNQRRNQLDQWEKQLAAAAGVDEFHEEEILAHANKALEDHGVKAVESHTELISAQVTMTKLVEEDPRAREIAETRAASEALLGVELDEKLEQASKNYVDSLRDFADQAVEAIDVLLLDLFEKGLEVVDLRRAQDEDTNVCPLCGSALEEDLGGYIEKELQRLRELQSMREKVDDRMKIVRDLLPAENSHSGPLGRLWVDSEEQRTRWDLHSLSALATKLDKTLAHIDALLARGFDGATVDSVSELDKTVEKLAEIREEYEGKRKQLIGGIQERLAELEADESRALLVKAHSKVAKIVEAWPEYIKAKQAAKNLGQVSKSYKKTVEDFVNSSVAHIAKRFDAISDDVQAYFDVLEGHTEGLSNPSLKVLPEQERALVLEIEFQGERVAPAYKYLSESQMNSFGLAVFLASARHINSNFRFLILDDVINSFDAYKRPQVIHLLKQFFGDFQVLVLTHDDIWRNRLFEECSDWTRLRFKRYETGVGPIRDRGLMELEEIEQMLLDGKPVRAAQAMGPFLERHLQLICESFEVLVKYNQRNEYTLDPMLDRWRVRLREKLGTEHPLYIAVEDLMNDMGFRNFAAHWKEPSSHLTVPEMTSAVDRWKDVERQIRCDEPSCYGYPRYDGTGAFVCACGALKLEKV